MIVTNILFACLGLAFLAFGLIGLKKGFHGSNLFPPNTFKWLAILGGIVCVASAFGAIGAFVRKNFVTYIYMIVILAALVVQVLIGIKLYKASANVSTYMSDLWASSNASFRGDLQNEFNCCGFQTNMDKYIKNDQCDPKSKTIGSLSPCADILISFAKDMFGKAYLVVFAALALEVLAMSNAITLLCVRFGGGDEEDERRRRRKSGIKLDDMSVETPATLVGSSYTLSDEQKKFYATPGTSPSYTQDMAYNQKPNACRDSNYGNQYNAGHSNTYY